MKANNLGGTKVTGNVLDLPIDAQTDADEFVLAAMEWHFNPETGSAYWLQRAETLPFNPRDWWHRLGRGRMPAWTRTGLRGT